MKEEVFIERNSASWQSLETLSKKINNKGIKKLTSSEVKIFLDLFRKTSHHLAYARTHYPDSNIIKYLNNLLGKCHSNVYAVKKISPGSLKDYVFRKYPQILKDYRNYILISFAFFALGVLISMIMVLYNHDHASLFVPQEYIDTIKAGTEGSGDWNYALMSSYIMVNNIRVSITAFVLGITLGLGTVYVLFLNGAMLGALTTVVYLYGNPVSYWSLILPHGVIELTAIFIAGAAGLVIAKHMLIPGELKRKYSIISGTKKAISLLSGVIVMLIIAGIIEGFYTPLSTFTTTTKLAFAAFTGLILIMYFAIPYFKKDQIKDDRQGSMT
ncbi:MAG: stage II sporulation protein M [Halanaerobiales bacterium]